MLLYLLWTIGAPSVQGSTQSPFSLLLPKGANPQRVSTKIIIEIKQLYSGRIASNPFTANNRRYMVYPLRDDFPIENEFVFVYIFLYFDVTWPF